MKPKTIVILLILLVVLCGALVWQRLVAEKPPSFEQTKSILQRPVSFENLRRVEFTLGNPKSSEPALAFFLDKNSRWRVEGPFNLPLRAQKLELFVDHLNMLKGELRSNDASLLHDYRIGNDEGFHIELTEASGDSHHLIVGRHTASRGNFVRAISSDAVFFSDENLLQLIGYRPGTGDENIDDRGWVDRRIFDLDPKRITSFRWEEPTGTAIEEVCSLHRGDSETGGKWFFKKTHIFKVSNDKVERYLDALTKAEFTQAEPLDTDDPLRQSHRRITLMFGDGTELRCFVGTPRPEEASLPLYVEGRDYRMRIPTATLSRIFATDGNFFEHDPLRARSEDVTSVTLSTRDPERVVVIQPEAKETRLFILSRFALRILPRTISSGEEILKITIHRAERIESYSVRSKFTYQNESYYGLIAEESGQFYGVTAFMVDRLLQEILPPKEKELSEKNSESEA